MPETTYTLTEMPVLADYPFTPEGASQWEHQEITRLWREAVRARRELIERLATDHEVLFHVPDGPPHGLTTGSDAALLSKACQASAAQRMALDGVRHRQALAKATATPFDPTPYLKE